MDRFEIQDIKHAMSPSHYLFNGDSWNIFRVRKMGKKGKSQMSFVLFGGRKKKFTQMHIIKQPKIKHGIKRIFGFC